MHQQFNCATSEGAEKHTMIPAMACELGAPTYFLPGDHEPADKPDKSFAVEPCISDEAIIFHPKDGRRRGVLCFDQPR